MKKKPYVPRVSRKGRSLALGLNRETILTLTSTNLEKAVGGLHSGGPSDARTNCRACVSGANSCCC